MGQKESCVGKLEVQNNAGRSNWAKAFDRKTKMGI